MKRLGMPGAETTPWSALETFSAWRGSRNQVMSTLLERSAASFDASSPRILNSTASR